MEIKPIVRKVESVHKVTKIKTPTLDHRIEKYEDQPVIKETERKKRILNLWI
jgi:hypothetical protein|tara:strand:+ start:494 stop:649 length:156 start_codon:yes stop_codon:yes gene_type:complete